MMRKNLWIACGVAVIVVMAGLLVYGSYISAQYQMEALQTAAREQWVQLDGALRRLADSTPQLESALAPMTEQGGIPLDALKNARQTLMQAHDPQAVISAGQGLHDALTGVMTRAAQRPDLRTDAKFQDAQKEILHLQVRVAQDRERYNESLRNYDTFVGDFPNSMWARIAGFHPDHHFFPKTPGADKSTAD